MSSQTLKILAIALLIGSVILIALAIRIGKSPQPTPPEPVATSAPPRHKIVTAARTIRPGETIDYTDITLTPFESPPAKAIEIPEEVLGKQLMVGAVSGEPLLRTHFPPVNILAQSLGNDERAVAIKVDELIGVGGYLHPGDRVDVLAYLRGDGQRTKENQAIVVLNSVRILAYGEESPGNVGSTNPEETAKAAKNRGTAVLAVKTRDATRLVLAENSGVMRLALRPAPVAAMEPAGQGATLSQMLPVPQHSPPDDKPKGPQVFIIRGANVETVQLP